MQVPQSLANVLTHLIFSSKNRFPFLADKALRQRTHAYLAAVLKDMHSPALIVGGVADHLHILCQLSRTSALSGVIEQLKVSSSKWVKTQGVGNFSWQRGYGAFSISQSQVTDVLSYIEKQEEHHQKMTFQEEYRLFLKRYRLAFDERYVWD
jgi:REP element-mobilizing transposase RayT